MLMKQLPWLLAPVYEELTRFVVTVSVTIKIFTFVVVLHFDFHA